MRACGRIAPNAKLVQVDRRELEALLRILEWIREKCEDFGDVEGWELQQKMVELNLMETVPATADDAQQEWAQEWNILEGDDCLKPTELGERLLNRLDSMGSESET